MKTEFSSTANCNCDEKAGLVSMGRWGDWAGPCVAFSRQSAFVEKPSAYT